MGICEIERRAGNLSTWQGVGSQATAFCAGLVYLAYGGVAGGSGGLFLPRSNVCIKRRAGLLFSWHSIRVLPNWDIGMGRNVHVLLCYIR